MALKDDLIAAVKRFKLVEPVTIEDMDTIAKHVRFALAGDAKVEVFRNESATTTPKPIVVGAWRAGAMATLQIVPFTSAAEATKARGT